MKTEVLIIGGGIAGLALANLLGKAGLEIVLVEKRAFPVTENTDHFGRTAALMGSSVNILKALEVWDELEKRTAPLETMRIIDDGNPTIDPIQIDFPAKDAGLDYFGHNIPNNMLHAILSDKAMAMKNIKIISPAELQSFETDETGITATLNTGEKIAARIIVGADGRNSPVRTFANIGVQEKKYDQSAITCLIEHSKPHNNTSTEHHRAGGPFTTVPMPDDNGKHISSVVWVEKTAEADGFIKLDKASFEKALQKRTRNALGAVTLASNPECWPLSGVIADKITAPRIALIAEAAHVMSPIGAQGLNLSLRDVATLAETLIDAARLGEDIGSELTLARYAKRRSIDMKSRFFGVDGYNRIVSNNIGFLRGVRRAGLKSLQAIPAFKQLAMHQGLTPVMDEGRLMRGENL